MDNRIDVIKGIHPGKLISRDLKKKGLTQRSLGLKTSIPYQTINAIVAGRRKLTIEQAIKIEKSLGYEEGFLSILQTHYDIKVIKEKELSTSYPGKPLIRKILFWDTDFDKINWGKHKKAVIKRVMEKGNTKEIKAIAQFYNLSSNEMKKIKPNYAVTRFKPKSNENPKPALRNHKTIIEKNSR